MNDNYKDHVLVERSKGRSSSGVTYYLRPLKPCFNRSRHIICYDHENLDNRVIKMIAKWYWPLKFYNVDGVIIGSNSENNALQEYWRVCDPSKRNKFIEVIETTPPCEDKTK